MVSRKCPQKSVESPVHQQDKYAGAGSCEGGGVKGLSNLYGKTWDCKSSKELSYEGCYSSFSASFYLAILSYSVPTYLER